jgi:hypothetical protein
MKEILEPAGADTTGIVDETPSGLVALDDLRFVAGGLRELMKCYLIFPASHSGSFLSNTVTLEGASHTILTRFLLRSEEKVFLQFFGDGGARRAGDGLFRYGRSMAG